MRSGHRTLTVCFLLLAACGGDEMTRVDGMPALPEVESTTVASEAPLVALASHDGWLYAAADGLPQVVSEGALEAMDVDGDVGAVLSMTTRSDDVLLAAEGGMFETHADQLLTSPLSESLADIDIRDLRSTGDELWIAASDGIYHIVDGGLYRIAAAELPAPTMVHGGSGVVLAVANGELFEIVDGGAEAVPYELGAVHGIASHGATTYLATDQGLIVREADGNYTQYTLSNGSPVPVDAVIYDPLLGAVAATANGLVAIDPSGDLVGLAAGDASGTALACDDIGHVWLATDDALVGYAVSEPVSFETVAPIMDETCVPCHSDPSSDAPQFDLTDESEALARADAIWEQIDRGSMPLAPYALSDADVETLGRWYRSIQ